VKKRLRRFKDFVGPTPEMLRRAAERRLLYMHSAARKRALK
jgi:hypothetical protein